MTEEMVAVFAGSSIRLAAPLLLAASGELVSERAGVLNMSVEGHDAAGRLCRRRRRLGHRLAGAGPGHRRVGGAAAGGLQAYLSITCGPTRSSPASA
jgi:simple sugar transport system permease protein